MAPKRFEKIKTDSTEIKKEENKIKIVKVLGGSLLTVGQVVLAIITKGKSLIGGKK